MRRDSFAAGFWCALVVVALILVARREGPRPEVLSPVQAPITVPARFVSDTTPAPPPPLVVQQSAYVGNINTHRFHLLSCRYASCSNCTARFATREEAIEAGFRPGGCCHP
jgi:hypothetical protein